MASKYITAQKFDDFARNQEIMIKTFNHNITEIKDAVLDMKEKVAGFMGEFKIVKKLVWWILGIISLIVGVAILSVVSQS